MQKEIERHRKEIEAKTSQLIQSKNHQKNLENKRSVLRLELQLNQELLEAIDAISRDLNFEAGDFQSFRNAYADEVSFNSIPEPKPKEPGMDVASVEYFNSIFVSLARRVIYLENKDNVFDNKFAEIERVLHKHDAILHALMTKIADIGEYEVVCGALERGGQPSAKAFIKALVELIEGEHIISTNIKAKKFKIDDGRNGLFTNAVSLIISIALPVIPGLGDVIRATQELL